MPSLLRLLRSSEISDNVSGFNSELQKNLAAKTLYSVLSATLWISVSYLAVVVPLFVTRKVIASAAWGIVIAVTLTCIFVLRQRFVRLSSWIFLATAWLMMAMFVTLSGGIRSPFMLGQFAALSTLAKTLIEKRGHLSEQELDSFIAAGFTKEQVLEVIAIVAASTITNYAGTITNPPLEDPFRQHAWQG
jgi:hypothetical protein